MTQRDAPLIAAAGGDDPARQHGQGDLFALHVAGKPIVLHDREIRKSALGYDMSKVYTLEGGFNAWSETYADKVEG